jgi:hypothetical protein
MIALHWILLGVIVMAVFLLIHLALTKKPKDESKIMKPCGCFNDTPLSKCESCPFVKGKK